MKKILIYTTFTLANFALLYPGHASASIDNSRVLHVNKDVQYTPNRWRLVRHTFAFRLPQKSKPLSQIIITIPSTVAISNDINVVEQNGKKIDVNVSANGKKIILSFPEPIAPNTRFNINLNKVKQPILGPTSVYSFSAKFVGSEAEIPIGIAQFRTN